MSSTSSIREITGISIGFDVSTSDGERRGSSRSSAVPDRDPRDKENTDATGLKLSEEEKEAVRKLQQRDREVRTHEQAHIAASGGNVMGGPSYTRQRGPDGQMYAIGGHVNIDTSTEDDPDATIAKAQRVRAAANAPAEPSGQDRAVAARASQMEAQARQEKTEEKDSRSSIDGPVALSRSSLEGPASSVSGPPQSLNRRVDSFGNPDNFASGNVQTQQQAAAQANAQASRNAEAYAAQDAQALAAARMYAQTDAAAAQERQAIAAADAMAAYQSAQSLLQATQNADAANAADLQALQAGDLNAAYARTLDVYALGSADSTQFSNQFSASPQQDLPVREASRLGVPTARPSEPSLPQAPVAMTALSSPAASPTPSNTAMERATRVYQRMGYTPTALAPYGTGISRTV